MLWSFRLTTTYLFCFSWFVDIFLDIIQFLDELRLQIIIFFLQSFKSLFQGLIQIPIFRSFFDLLIKIIAPSNKHIDFILLFKFHDRCDFIFRFLIWSVSRSLLYEIVLSFQRLIKWFNLSKVLFHTDKL